MILMSLARLRNPSLTIDNYHMSETQKWLISACLSDAGDALKAAGREPDARLESVAESMVRTIAEAYRGIANHASEKTDLLNVRRDRLAPPGAARPGRLYPMEQYYSMMQHYSKVTAQASSAAEWFEDVAKMISGRRVSASSLAAAVYAAWKEFLGVYVLPRTDAPAMDSAPASRAGPFVRFDLSEAWFCLS